MATASSLPQASCLRARVLPVLGTFCQHPAQCQPPGNSLQWSDCSLAVWLLGQGRGEEKQTWKGVGIDTNINIDI